MIVAPLTRLAAGNLRAFRHVVPAIGPVIDGMEDQTLVIGRLAEIRPRGVEQRVEHSQSCLRVAIALLAPALEHMPEPQQPCAAIAAAELSTGSKSLKGSASRSPQPGIAASPGAPVSQ